METDLPPDSTPLPEPAVLPTVAPAVPVVPSVDPPLHKDRGTGFVVFGVFQIILGLMSALMIPLAALGMFMSRLTPGGAMRPGQFVSSFATYAFAAAALISLGAGSVQMKRWAHALTLVTSWYWLIMGILLTVLLTAVLPVSMRGALAQMKATSSGASSTEMSTGIMAVFLTIMIAIMAFFLIVVPIAFLVFYGRKDVAETCRRRDPVERWTDRTPLPILGASVVLFATAVYMLLVGVTTPLIPFFGTYLTGIPAVISAIALAGLDFYLAVAIFRLQPAGWWIAVLAAPVRILSLMLTYGRADLMQAYSRIGMSDAQVQMLKSNPMFRGHLFLWWSLISVLLFFGYLVWLKRFFKSSPFAANETLPTQIA